MKLGIIIETKEPEKAWNAFRFAATGRKLGHEVKVFLMGEAVECEGLHHEKYDVGPISTMVDCLELVDWADKTVTF